MANDIINSLNFGGDTHVFTLPYGVCDTAANTKEKEVTVDNFPTVDDEHPLEAGTTVIVKFTYDSNIASPTLNVNGTGDIPIYRYATTEASTGDSTTGWRANSIHLFTYDGAGWMRTFWENTTYSNVALGHGYATCTTAAATVAKTASLSSYTLTANGRVSVRFTNGITVANSTLNINSKGAKAIYFNGAALTDTTLIQANDVVTFVYSSQYHIVAINGSVCTAGSYGPSANATPAYGATFNVPYITVDQTGRITDISNKTVKIPASDNTDTKVTQAEAIATAGEYPVILGYSTATTAVTNTVNKTSTLKYNPSTKVLTTGGLTVNSGNIILNTSNYGSTTPSSGTAGQLFFVEDDSAEIYSLPAGGTSGQYLIKGSDTDGDASWQNLDLNAYENVNGDYGLVLSIDGDGNPNYDTAIYTQNHVLQGAAWNDYAEYRQQKEEIEPGYCVASSDNGKVYKTTEKFQACDGIVSDTFGFAIGQTENSKTPLAVAGRVLAYCSGNREDYHAGDTVCAGPEGKVCKMTREEIREWPDRVIGIVSEIPTYEVWGQNNIKVNNRIWIKIK